MIPRYSAAIVFFALTTVGGGTFIIYHIHADNSTLDDVKAQVISDGFIPDTYFIAPAGPYWEAYDGDINFTAIQQFTSELGNSASAQAIKQFNTAQLNLAVLLESRHEIDLHYIYALEIAKQNTTGTTNEPDYMIKYLTHLSETYDIPTTPDGIQFALSSTLGDLAPLSSDIADLVHTGVSFGVVPNSLAEGDAQYWFWLTSLTMCELDHGDCSLQREMWENRGWDKESTPIRPQIQSFEPPIDSEEWALNFYDEFAATADESWDGSLTLVGSGKAFHMINRTINSIETVISQFNDTGRVEVASTSSDSAPARAYWQLFTYRSPDVMTYQYHDPGNWGWTDFDDEWEPTYTGKSNLYGRFTAGGGVIGESVDTFAVEMTLDMRLTPGGGLMDTEHSDVHAHYTEYPKVQAWPAVGNSNERSFTLVVNKVKATAEYNKPPTVESNSNSYIDGLGTICLTIVGDDKNNHDNLYAHIISVSDGFGASSGSVIQLHKSSDDDYQNMICQHAYTYKQYHVTYRINENRDLSGKWSSNTRTVTVSPSPKVVGDTSISVYENISTDQILDTYTATGFTGRVTWSLSGDDSSSFTITNGNLKFQTTRPTPRMT